MKSSKDGSRHVVDFLLVSGWAFAILIALGTYLVAGFYGWLAVFAWSAAAGPLAVFTARHLAAKRRPLDERCWLLAIRWWTLLALATLTTGLAPTVLDLGQLPLLAGLAVIGMWLAFLGQLLYVLSATSWMVGSIFALWQVQAE